MSLPRRAILAGGAACLAWPAHAVPERVRVRMYLDAGRVELDLFTRQAPISAADFLRYTDARAYDGGAVTRVVRADNDHGRTRIDVIQGGVRQDAAKYPPVVHETTRQTGLRHLDGTISLPRDTPGTGSGAEFFLCIGPQPSLDFGGGRNPDGQGFAAFGQVVSGMEVVRAVWRMETGGASSDTYTAGQMLRRPVRILAATRLPIP